jgi:hypothetical protein
LNNFNRLFKEAAIMDTLSERDYPNSKHNNTLVSTLGFSFPSFLKHQQQYQTKINAHTKNNKAN